MRTWCLEGSWTEFLVNGASLLEVKVPLAKDFTI